MRGARMNTDILGHSPQGSPIFCHEFLFGQFRCLVLGGVHGDEHEGVALAFKLLESFKKSFPYQLSISIIPMLNPDGVYLKTRTNSRNVDLNRNLPTPDWDPVAHTPRYQPGPYPLSEPENQALTSYLQKFQPHFILTL